MAESPTVSFKVSVGDQSFRVRIPADEKSFYESAARLTEATYEEITGKTVTGGPQAWAMAAFQIACDLSEARDRSGEDEANPEHRARIERLIQRIEDVTSSG